MSIEKTKNVSWEKFDFNIPQSGRWRLNPVVLKCFDGIATTSAAAVAVPNKNKHRKIRCNVSKEKSKWEYNVDFCSRLYERIPKSKINLWKNLICLYCMQCTRQKVIVLSLGEVHLFRCCFFSLLIRMWWFWVLAHETRMKDTMDYMEFRFGKIQ